MASSTAGAHDHPKGLRRFLFSTNHKDIGTLYLILAVIGGLVGMLMSVAIRADDQPRSQHRRAILARRHDLRTDPHPRN